MFVVIDTNVLISALLFRGSLEWVGDAIDEGAIIPCFTNETLEELSIAIGHSKFEQLLMERGMTPEDILESAAASSYIRDALPIRIDIGNPKDEKIVIAAVSCGAACIVTGDKKLLSLKEFKGIPILSPKEFLLRVKKL